MAGEAASTLEDVFILIDLSFGSELIEPILKCLLLLPGDQLLLKLPLHRLEFALICVLVAGQPHHEISVLRMNGFLRNRILVRQ